MRRQRTRLQRKEETSQPGSCRKRMVDTTVRRQGCFGSCAKFRTYSQTPGHSEDFENAGVILGAGMTRAYKAPAVAALCERRARRPTSTVIDRRYNSRVRVIGSAAAGRATWPAQSSPNSCLAFPVPPSPTSLLLRRGPSTEVAVYGTRGGR